MIRSGNSPINESFKASDLKKGEWVVVNIEPRLSGFARLVPVKVSVVGSPTFRGWAYNEREHEYSTGSVLYLAKSEDDAQKFIDSNKGKTVKQLKESVNLNESTYDGDTVNWNKISAGDVVGWTIEGMGRLPKVGDDFRVGPFIGKCTKVSGSKVYMKIESDARELDENMNESDGVASWKSVHGSRVGLNEEGEPIAGNPKVIEALKNNQMNEASGRHPKLGKKVKQLKGWKIYQGTDSSGEEVFRCFTPDDDYPAVGYEDWECETLDQAIEWIKNY